MTAQQLIDSTNALQLIRSEISCLQAQVYLLKQLAGNTMTATTLITTATKDLQLIRDRHTAEQCIIYLLQQIVAGGGTGGGTQSGNYSGGAPTGIASPTQGMFAIDNNTGNLWVYFNGAWEPTGITVP